MLSVKTLFEHAPHFHTLTYRAPCSFLPEPFAEMMQALPDEVRRAKGFVRFHDSSKQWELQYNGKEFFIGPVSLTLHSQDHLVFMARRLTARRFLPCSIRVSYRT